MIYFLGINNMKYMINSEVIERIATFNFIWIEKIPDKYLDSITLEIMYNPVQLLI